MANLKAKALSEKLSVTGQISPADLPEIVRAGFKSVMCNRPDGESVDQFNQCDLADAAKSAGLTLAYLPVVSGQVTPKDGQAFADMLNELPSPVLAYCRSGMRSATLWALSQVASTPWPEILHRAAAAGFDLSKLSPPEHRDSSW